MFFKEKSNSGVCDMDKNSSSSIVKEKLIDSIEIINNKASNNIITNLNENNASNSSSGNRKSLNKSNDSDNSNSTSASSKNSTQNRSSNFYKNLNTPVKSGKATFEPNKLNKKLNATNNETLRNRLSNSCTIKSSESGSKGDQFKSNLDRNGLLLNKELESSSPSSKTNSYNLINSNKLNNKEPKHLNSANDSKIETKILMVGLILLLLFVCLIFYSIY